MRLLELAQFWLLPLILLNASLLSLAVVVDPRCLEPLDLGVCRMRLNRFYYNREKNSCEPFQFTGCGGNGNKFGFKPSCERTCVTPTSGPVTSVDRKRN